MLRVGLTGGIACGKSRVLRRLAAAGFHTFDLDAIAHELMAPGGSVYADVVRAFGTGVLGSDGAVDRKALGSLVFADPEARIRLNAIVHPRVRAEEARRAALYAADPEAVVVTDAALLVEAGVHLRFDRLVVVHCEEREQRRRLMQRDGLDAEAAAVRIASQMPVEEKKRFAHFVVEAAGPLEDTDRASDELAKKLRAVARSRAPRIELPLDRALGCLVHGPGRGPRGLGPVDLLAEIVATKGLEMERLARLLVPPAPGAWYRAALGHEPGFGPETLAGPLVLLALARSAPDPEWLLAAAYSLAALTHSQPASIAGACLMAQMLLHVAVAGGITEEVLEKQRSWSAHAQRWAGSPPPDALAAVLRVALGHPADPSAARRAAEERGGNADLAGALVGMASGLPASQAPEPLLKLVRTLGGGIADDRSA